MAVRSAIVVGGGVIGLSTACALVGRGVQVTLLERHTVGHPWASSHGMTRAIRHEYGPNRIYTQMVARSLTRWDELERESGRRLYTETGVLTLGQEGDGQTLAGYEIMRDEGLPVERLSPEECAARFPQFDPAKYSAITWNPRGGMLYASECLLALRERLTARGGTLREGARVTQVEQTGGAARVWLEGAATLEADYVVVTAGPWALDVVPGLRATVRPTRQQITYFAGADPALFAIGTFPVFLAEMECYGFPMHGPGWLKIASHVTGATVDPDAGYEPDLDEIEFVREFIRRVIPRAESLEVALVDRCMYDMTPDEDFILDRLPGSERITIGSGFSGHGFKFGPLTGALLAAVALGEEPEFSLERFRLTRFTKSAGAPGAGAV
ncbi:MAG TPA: N-methyl-L-tryptophan oxidase [Ktedonobacterales bacterium]